MRSQLETTPPYSGADMVADANDAFQTIATDFAGATDPAAMAWPYATWADTGNGLIKRRNAAGTDWDVEGSLSLNAGTDHAGAEPANPVAHMTWADTASGLLKRRNAANTAWVDLGPLFATDRPAFVAYVSGGQTLSIGVMTKITFLSAFINQGGGFLSGKFQPNVAGLYSLFGRVSTAVSTKIEVAIYKNGALYSINYGASSSGTSVISDLLILNGTSDYVELYARTGSTTNVYGVDGSTSFSGNFIGPSV